jgi:poly(A) polymerase
METPEVKRLLQALGAPDVDVRFVGGCVRNAVINAAVGEIDIGTPDVPTRVTQRLEAAGIKAVPTGIDHGTITAVVDGVPFEITTLRRDTACDGRHAAVEFTADWHEDVRRRDFTMNALSLRVDGTLFDDHGGVEDAKAGRVRFVGEPGDRIQEDYLRILRLFRFYAWYGREPIDPATVEACRKHAPGLSHLSAERIQQELAKLLAAKNPTAAVQAMFDAGVAQHVLPGARDARALAALIEIEPQAREFPAHWLRRLAALVPSADSLKLSNADRERLKLISDKSAITNTNELHRALYRTSAAIVVDRLLLAGVADRLLTEAMAWTEKKLPVGGNDVLALGVAPGPKVGELLGLIEEWWIDAGFAPSREEALAKLETLAHKK